MDHPVSRVLAVLELLQTHGRLSGPELARRLGVHPRTVRRYVALLEELGIPLTAERGRAGAYALMSGFKLPPLMFSGAEAVALSLGLLAARGLGLADGQAAVASAQAKLERVMPANLRRRVRAIDETVRLELPGRGAHAMAAPDGPLAALTEAAQAGRRVRLRYRGPDGRVTERGFEPYGLAHHGGRWYAAGLCHLRGGVRSFRLDRVEEVAPLEERFERPAGFDALEHVTTAIALVPRRHAAEVLLRTDLASARRELFGAFGVLVPCEGGVRLRIQADDLDWVARELARLPFELEVVGPPALHAALARCAARLARLAARPSGARA